MAWQKKWLRNRYTPLSTKTCDPRCQRCRLLFLRIFRLSTRSIRPMNNIPMSMKIFFLLGVSSNLLFLWQRTTSTNTSSASWSFWPLRIVWSGSSVSKMSFWTPDHWLQYHNEQLGDSNAQGWHLACCWCSWTGQSPCRTASLYYLSIVLSSHPSPAKSQWFLMPIGWLDRPCSRPRRKLVQSAPGLILPSAMSNFSNQTTSHYILRSPLSSIIEWWISNACYSKYE